jgi:hypothetical protein
MATRTRTATSRHCREQWQVEQAKPTRQVKPNVRSDGAELVAAVIELSDDDEADDMTT